MHNLCGFPGQKLLHSTWSVGLEGLLLSKHSPCKHPILWQSRNGVFGAVFFLLELVIKLTSNAWVIFKPYSSNNCVRIHAAICGFCTKFELSFTADWTARDKCKFVSISATARSSKKCKVTILKTRPKPEWIVRQECSFGMFSTFRFAPSNQPTKGSNWPLLIKKRHFTDRGVQLTF